jgi:hypothetical protein
MKTIAVSRLRSNRNTRLLIAILAVSVILRVAAAFYLGNQVVDLPGTADQVSYHNLALRVLTGHGFSFAQVWWPLTPADSPTAHWSFLYTLYLVAVYTVFGVHPIVARLIQAVLVGILHPYLIYRLAAHVFGRNRDEIQVIPLLAAGITAIYTYFVYYAATLMTEPFYITAVLAALFVTMLTTDRPAESDRSVQGGEFVRSAWLNRRDVQLGLALGATLAIAALSRQLILTLVPFLILWLVIAAYRQKRWRPILTPVVIALIVIGLCILPFTIFNYARFGRFVLLNTNTGYALFWANHPIYGTNFVGILPANGPSYQDLIPQELRGLDEISLEQALMKRGIQFIVDDPVRYALLSLSRIKTYFKFWPDPESGAISNIARVTSFGIFLPFMLYGLLRAFRDRSLTSAWLLYWFVLGYTSIHLLSWALIRYRLPVDAVLILFAAYGITDLIRLFTRPKTAEPTI